MTSFSDLVNSEVGNATNYGGHFKLNIVDAIPAMESLLERHKYKTTNKTIRVYSPGGMQVGTAHIGYFQSGIL
jgi:hypothetical protein